MLSSGDASSVGTVSDKTIEARFTPTMLSMIKLKATLLPLNQDAIAAALAYSYKKTVGYDPDVYGFSYEGIRPDACMTANFGGGYGGIKGPKKVLSRGELRYLVFYQSKPLLLSDPAHEGAPHSSILSERIRMYQEISNDLITYAHDVTDNRYKLVVVYDESAAVLMTHDYSHGLYIHLHTLDKLRKNACRSVLL
jgi:hypothetical protein